MSAPRYLLGISTLLALTWNLALAAEPVPMSERWMPVLWIIGLGVGVFVLILLLDLVKERFKKKKR
jgi:hypothetical protein